MTSIRQVATNTPTVLAFEIHGEIQKEDLDGMARTMNEAFDRHDSVNMLMIFQPYDGAESGATLDWEVVKSNFRSLSNVERYAVVASADGPKRMVDFMDHLMPVDAETFDRHESEAAWAFVGAERL